MRLFQNSAIYPSYRPRLARLREGVKSFEEATKLFLEDRFGAAHFLKPVLDQEPEAFFANGDDDTTQQMWATEQGMPPGVGLEDILLAQIEHHGTEVFYNLDPMRYGNGFLPRVRGCVRRAIAWRAAPSAGGAFNNHDLVVSNFPSIAEGFRQQGAKVAHFTPAHDPEMNRYATNTDRPIDILFVGTYSRHHVRRAKLLEAIAGLGNEFRIVMHLDTSRFTALADSPLGLIGPLRKYRRPLSIRKVGLPPVFGRDLLQALGQAKIVFNGAIDMSGQERGNMRVWEALGCGAAMVADEGLYPDPMQPGRDFEIYGDAKEAVTKIRELLRNDEKRADFSRQGHQMIRTSFSKEKQWELFQLIAS